jgi:hypothetical protein
MSHCTRLKRECRNRFNIRTQYFTIARVSVLFSMSHLTLIADEASILVTYKRTTILAQKYQRSVLFRLQKSSRAQILPNTGSVLSSLHFTNPSLLLPSECHSTVHTHNLHKNASSWPVGRRKGTRGAENRGIKGRVR